MDSIASGVKQQLDELMALERRLNKTQQWAEKLWRSSRDIRMPQATEQGRRTRSPGNEHSCKREQYKVQKSETNPSSGSKRRRSKQGSQRAPTQSKSRTSRTSPQASTAREGP